MKHSETGPASILRRQDVELPAYLGLTEGAVLNYWTSERGYTFLSGSVGYVPPTFSHHNGNRHTLKVLSFSWNVKNIWHSRNQLTDKNLVYHHLKPSKISNMCENIFSFTFLLLSLLVSFLFTYSYLLYLLTYLLTYLVILLVCCINSNDICESLKYIN